MGSLTMNLNQLIVDTPVVLSVTLCGHVAHKCMKIFLNSWSKDTYVWEICSKAGVTNLLEPGSFLTAARLYKGLQLHTILLI